MQAVSSNLRFMVDSDRGFTIAITFTANGIKVYITRRRLDMLAKAAASVTGVPGSVVPWTSDEESVKAGAKHIEEIDRKFDILVNKLVCRALRSSRPYTDAFRVPICWSCHLDLITKRTRAEDPFEPQIVQSWADIFTLNAIAPFFAMRAFQLRLVKGAQS
ncbi:uncharacterized protein ARMOST_06571 [Armillaria ostoyae]|uniref:Uncharacterized protein n=1 Tax=Armillaria ostoyae TaxID=47428 RepID=A0A284R3D9_ARMOS|nr:uncharacterized protein ARMOST_06571 [Armillaria ostoyae]